MQNTKENSYRVDPRHIARLLAVQYLFSKQKSQSLGLPIDFFTSFEPNHLLEINDERKANLKLFEKIVEGVENCHKDIDAVIQELAPAWPLDQINTVDLVILRSGIWEAFVACLTPEKVVINEAIELGKKLSSVESKSFINGVLGKILPNEELKNRLKKLNE